MNWWRKFLSDNQVASRYVCAGSHVGSVVNYFYREEGMGFSMGRCSGFEELLDRWDGWEQEYARRGFRTISLDAFVEYGGQGFPINHFVGQRRYENESPVFHAQMYGAEYLRRAKSKTGSSATPSIEEIATKKKD